jgi:hypothetical protein
VVGLLLWLPPGFAVIPAGTAIAIAFVPTATAAAAETTAAATTVAAAVSATATATIATAAAISSGTSFVNRQITAVEVLAVELLDGRSRFFRGRHLDKAETSRATRHAIFYDLSRFNITRLGKVVAQIIAGRLEREISHVEFCSHFFSVL